VNEIFGALAGYWHHDMHNAFDLSWPRHEIESSEIYPLGIGHQADALELMTEIFQRLEDSSPEMKNLLQKVFYYTRYTIEICQNKEGCPNKVQWPEEAQDFKFLTVNVKHMNTLKNALDKHFEVKTQDKLQYCEYCCGRNYDKTVQMEYKDMIRDLPNTFVIHLNRFQFNPHTLRKEKIADPVQFDLEVDMYPYTKEAFLAKTQNIKDHRGGPEYWYRLKGVVIHSGTKTSGHYYSYVRSDRGNRWVRLDDSRVTKDVSWDGQVQRDSFGKSPHFNRNHKSKAKKQKN